MEILTGLQQCLPNAELSGLEPLSAGWETDVYGFVADGRPLVLRVYSGGDPWNRSAVEAHALQTLSDLGYPVPGLVAHSTDPTLFGGAYLIMERVAGQVMWRHFGKATVEPPQIKLFCSLLHRLHSLNARSFGLSTPSSFDLSIIQMMGGPHSKAFEPLFTQLERREPSVNRQRRSLIHGDFHPNNILIGPGEAPFVIDWSSAALEDPRADVAQAMALAITDVSPEYARQIQAGYEELNGGPLPNLDYFVLLALARRVLTVVVTVASGSQAIGLRPGLEQQLRPQIPRIRELVGLLEQMSGEHLPLVYALLEA